MPLGGGQTWFQILPLPLVSCVSMKRDLTSLNLTSPPPLWDGEVTITSEVTARNEFGDYSTWHRGVTHSLGVCFCLS